MLSFHPRRKESNPSSEPDERDPQTKRPSRTRLPSDYLKLVCETFQSEFQSELKHLESLKPGIYLEGEGFIYPNEITLSLSLVHSQSIQAVSFHASCDFTLPPAPSKDDPSTLSGPVEEILAACVDAMDLLLSSALDAPQKREALLESPLTLLDHLPIEWTSVTAQTKKVFLKVDGTHPGLEKMTQDWLLKNHIKEN